MKSSPAVPLPRDHRLSWLGLIPIAILLSWGLLGSVGPQDPQRLLRLGGPLERLDGREIVLSGARLAAGIPYKLTADFSVTEVGLLRLRARGTASFLSLGWKTASDAGFPHFREIHVPLTPDDRERTYEVNLNDTPFWNGEIRALRLLIDAGTLDVAEIRGQRASGAYRSISLGGETHPSLPATSHLSFDLAQELPRSTVFETQVGLLPEYDRPGVEARFRVEGDVAGSERAMAQATLQGGGDGRHWTPLRARLPRGTRRLRLSVEATRDGAPLPEGVGMWGDPVLVSAGKPAGKNLVLVVIDTLRADRLGSYGSRKGLTPSLDAFAAESVRFAEMRSPAPWTLPSVSALITGLEPQTHRAGERFGSFAPTGLAGGARTLAEVLRDQGFYTLGVYHNIYVNPAFGLDQGFDEYAALETPAGPLVDAALARLRRLSGDRRFFLYLHLFDPHNPYEPPAEECQSVARRLAPVFANLPCHADRAPELPEPPAALHPWFEALYDAEVAATDRQVGRFLRGLDALGHKDDTVVAIVSDHGEAFWDRPGEKARGYEANSDHGHALYEELLRVPALIRDPGRAPQVVSGIATLTDLFPTLLSWVNVAPPPNQGRDLTPRLTAAAAERPTLIADVILHGPPRWSVRRGPWKLIVPRDPALPVELYDLDRDPGERTDRATREPEVVRQLRALGEREIAARVAARSQLVQGNAPAAPYLAWNYITKLRALGYLR